LVCTAATSTAPASPAHAPPSPQADRMSRVAGSPTSCAVRGLPPTTRTEKPEAVARSHQPSPRHATTPMARPQWMSEPPMPPMSSPSFSA
jgi:hypothetical protein